jgi:hypothetical protein
VSNIATLFANDITRQIEEQQTSLSTTSEHSPEHQFQNSKLDSAEGRLDVKIVLAAMEDCDLIAITPALPGQSSLTQPSPRVSGLSFSRPLETRRSSSLRTRSSG